MSRNKITTVALLVLALLLSGCHRNANHSYQVTKPSGEKIMLHYRLCKPTALSQSTMMIECYNETLSRPEFAILATEFEAIDK
jgi:PBP1b-binding outer membrane lipoprotein LpoB